MPKNLRVIFDQFVLKPIWLLFLAIAIYYFTQKEWLIGSLMLPMVFFIGMIAAALHKEKSFPELSGGYPTRTDVYSPDQMSEWDANRAVGIAYMRLGFLISVASLILCFHYGLRWYYCCGIAVLIGWFGPVMLFVPFAFLGGNKFPEENSEEDTQN